MPPFKRPRALGEASRPRDASSTSSRSSEEMRPPPAPRSDASSSRDTASTFSTIVAPDLEQQQQMLLEFPAVTQAQRIPKRFRREQSTVEDVGWVFKHIFFKSEYKGRQEDIMKASLQGSDILVIAPTGMGKSLCFQVPAVAERHGMTLVVSPLLSLMQDQINALKKLDIPCAMLSSKTTPEEQKEILNDMESGHPKNRLLYITPERLASAPFRRKLRILHKQQELNRLVVDEAHCISEWGPLFRPDYSKLGEFRCEFPKVPIMALTASATPKVQDDIIAELGLDLELLFKVIHPFNRRNLFYEVRYFSESNDGPRHRQEDMINFINRTVTRGGNRPTSGIIYCRAKKTCDELSAWLRGKGVLAAPFHRGLKDKEADENQKKWVENDALAEQGKTRVDCIVATIAFGMGIDKSNCRYVIHFDVPKSFEGYYQETGRAGRDSHAARCIMYYSAEDKLRIKELVRKSHASRERKADRDHSAAPSQRAPESIDALLNYAEDVKTCRHVLICRYFGEKIAKENTTAYCDRLCDVCRDPQKTRTRRDEGLVELDFAATQAVSHDVDEYDVDPDDFYEMGKMSQIPEEGSEEESDEEKVKAPARKCREGFRSAAVEHDRGKEKARAVQGPAESSPLEGEIEYVVPLKGRPESDNDEMVVEGPQPPTDAMELSDDEMVAPEAEEEPMDIPSPAQPSREEKKRRLSPPPKPQCEEVSIASDLEEDEDEEVLPHWKDLSKQHSARQPPKENRPPAPLDKSKNKAKVVPIVSVAQKLPLVGAIGQNQHGAFNTPFADPTRNPKYKPNNTLKEPGQSPSSTGDEPPGKFDVVPLYYEKKIPISTRNDGVVHLVKYLQRAFLSKHGFRSSSSEEQIWKELGAKQADHEMRRKILLATALEIESDLFWTTLTPVGYRQFLAPRTQAVQSLISEDGPLPAIEGPNKTSDSHVEEVVKALKRAVTATLLLKKRKKKAKRKVDDEE